MPLIRRLQSNQNHPNEGRRSHARHTIGRRVWDRGRKRWIAAFSPLPCRSRCWIEMSSRPSWEERGHPRGPGCGSTAVPAHCPLSQCACVTKALNWRGWAESDAVTKLHIEQNRPILQSFMLVSVKSSTVDSARISNPSCQSHVTYGDDYIRLLFWYAMSFVHLLGWFVLIMRIRTKFGLWWKRIIFVL